MSRIEHCRKILSSHIVPLKNHAESMDRKINNLEQLLEKLNMEANKHTAVPLPALNFDYRDQSVSVDVTLLANYSQLLRFFDNLLQELSYAAE